MTPEIQLGGNGCYFIKMGLKQRPDGIRAPYHFHLATDEVISRDRAARLWELWLTQGETWTEEGLRQAREIAKGKDHLVEVIASMRREVEEVLGRYPMLKKECDDVRRVLRIKPKGNETSGQ